MQHMDGMEKAAALLIMHVVMVTSVLPSARTARFEEGYPTESLRKTIPAQTCASPRVQPLLA